MTTITNNKAIKGGKKPIEQKHQDYVYQNEDDIFGNRLNVDSRLKKELAEKGLEYRFINFNKYKEDGNFHNRGWQPYISQKNAQTAMEKALGQQPDGLFRRGDLVLAVRPASVGDRHRKILREKNLRQKGIQAQRADDLKQVAKESRGAVSVVEGYEENG